MYDTNTPASAQAHVLARQLLGNVHALPGPPAIRTDKHINLPINSRPARNHLTSEP